MKEKRSEKIRKVLFLVLHNFHFIYFELGKLSPVHGFNDKKNTLLVSTPTLTLNQFVVFPQCSKNPPSITIIPTFNVPIHRLCYIIFMLLLFLVIYIFYYI